MKRDKSKELADIIGRIHEFLISQKKKKKGKRISRQKIIALLAENMHEFSGGKSKKLGIRTVQGYLDGRTKNIPQKVIDAALELEKRLLSGEVDFFDPRGCKVLEGLEKYFELIVRELNDKNIDLMADTIISLISKVVNCSREQLERCLMGDGMLNKGERGLEREIKAIIEKLRNPYCYKVEYYYPIGCVIKIGYCVVGIVVEYNDLGHFITINSNGEVQTRVNGQMKLSESIKARGD